MSRNIRLALVIADTVQPYIQWTMLPHLDNNNNNYNTATGGGSNSAGTAGVGVSGGVDEQAVEQTAPYADAASSASLANDAAARKDDHHAGDAAGGAAVGHRMPTVRLQQVHLRVNCETQKLGLEQEQKPGTTTTATSASTSLSASSSFSSSSSFDPATGNVTFGWEVGHWCCLLVCVRVLAGLLVSSVLSVKS